MQRRLIGILALELTLAAFLAGAFAQTEVRGPDGEPILIYPAGSEPQPEPSPVLWDGSTAVFGSVRLDSLTKTVSATGWVNQTDGPIEVLACGKQGKVHESVFVLDLNPLDLQAALLLAGLKSGPPMSAVGEGPPQGDPLDVFVEWEVDGEIRRVRAEECIWQIQEGEALPESPWIFTGSMLRDGRFMAFAEESLVVNYWDPNAIVNLSHPHGADDDSLHANVRVLPPYGTPVRMFFVPR